MKLEEAIKMALEYEGRVHRLYVDAVKTATDDAGRKVFKVMADEERSHIEYLKTCLDQWQKDGHITAEELKTVIPEKEQIELELDRLMDTMEPRRDKYNEELDKLRKALAVEMETSAFYKKMVDEVEPDGHRLFERFLEIEQGHVAIVEAEIDSVSGYGYWFGHAEFNLESG